MAVKSLASTTLIDQPRPKTGAERQARYRERKRAKAGLPAIIAPTPAVEILPPAPKPRGFSLATLALRFAAVGVASVGLAMNATYARSLGSGDFSGWLFLVLGISADCAALALPSVAARSWQAGEKLTALAAWLTWATVFLFALLGSVGFASTSISDVTMARAGRVTPAVTAASLALSDAMTARDHECRGGVGKFCREREDAVTDARRGLDAAMTTVADGADPQAQAVTRLVTWVSRGYVIASPDDVTMLRLALLCLLPQIGGILLLCGRRSC